MAAVSIHSPAGTADVELHNRGTRLLGVNLGETAGSAATVILHDGDDANAEEKWREEVAANDSDTFWFGPQGIKFTKGVFLERSVGTTAVTVYVQ